MASLHDDIMSGLYGRNVWHDFAPLREREAEVQGWAGAHPALREAARGARGPIWIDVGVWKGQSTLTLAEIARPRRDHDEPVCIVAVDTFLGGAEHWHRGGHLFARPLGRPDLYQTFLENIYYHGAADLVVPMPIAPPDAARVLSELGLRAGLVHLDRARHFDDALRDAEAFWPLLDQGGVLVGGAYHETWPGAVKAAHVFATRVGGTLAIDEPKWWLRKEGG